MKITICTLTARRGFADLQAKMIAAQDYPKELLEWVLIDFAYEERAKLMQDLSKELDLNIVHATNVRNHILFFRDITRNRNKALQLATGDAVIFLDDYAAIPINFVSKHVEQLRGNNMSIGQMHRLERSIGNPDVPTERDDPSSPLSYLPDRYAELFAAYPDNMGKDDRNRNNTVFKAMGLTYTGNLGIPRIIFEHLNGFDPRMESGLEDADFGLRARIANFQGFYNPEACTINFDIGNAPYTYKFDHYHDVEPFISNFVNNFSGDDKLEGNEFLKIHFRGIYRIAECRICGATGMVDPREIMENKIENKIYRIPLGLQGGFDDKTLTMNQKLV